MPRVSPERLAELKAKAAAVMYGNIAIDGREFLGICADLADAEQRAAEAEAKLVKLKRGLRNNNTDFELAFLDAYLDKFRTLTADRDEWKRRAEAAEAELSDLKEQHRGCDVCGREPEDRYACEHLTGMTCEHMICERCLRGKEKCPKCGDGVTVQSTFRPGGMT